MLTWIFADVLQSKQAPDNISTVELLFCCLFSCALAFPVIPWFNLLGSQLNWTDWGTVDRHVRWSSSWPSSSNRFPESWRIYATDHWSWQRMVTALPKDKFKCAFPVLVRSSASCWWICRSPLFTFGWEDMLNKNTTEYGNREVMTLVCFIADYKL